MKGKKEDFVRGRFTRYLETAMDRSRRDYLKREKERVWKEVPKETELLECWPRDFEMESAKNCLEGLSWEPEVVRQCLKEWLDSRLWKCVAALTDLEIQVVFAKVFWQLTLAEIAEKMGIETQKAASVYSYARKKMKKRWEKNGD